MEAVTLLLSIMQIPVLIMIWYYVTQFGAGGKECDVSFFFSPFFLFSIYKL